MAKITSFRVSHGIDANSRVTTDPGLLNILVQPLFRDEVKDPRVVDSPLHNEPSRAIPMMFHPVLFRPARRM